MRDRYERLYTLPGLLYANSSPVIIEAGALLKDNQYNSTVAQLKFKNISDGAIKAITVMIFELDIAQRPLGEPVIFQYLDLSAKRNENFGQDVPVVLPDFGTRAFYVSVREVIFENNEVWNGCEDVWQPLPPAAPLDDFFKDSEMTKQFKMRYGADSNVCPVQIGDLWYCTCGYINHIDELTCRSCKKNAWDLFHVDLDSLAREKEVRLQKEAYEKQISEQKAAAKRVQIERELEKNKRSAQKKRRICIIFAILLVIASLLFVFIIKPAIKYKKAERLYISGEYDAARIAYEELGDYRDSAEKLKPIYYALIVRESEMFLYQNKNSKKCSKMW